MEHKYKYTTCVEENIQNKILDSRKTYSCLIIINDLYNKYVNYGE